MSARFCSILCFICLAFACQAPVPKNEVAKKTKPLLYLEELPVEHTEHPPILVLLHGYGSHERDLVDVGKRLSSTFFIVSIRAPIELGPDRYAWYDFSETQESQKHAAVERILASIDEVLGAMGRPKNEKIFISGFSQGGAMSLYTAAAAPSRFRAVVSFSPDKFSVPVDVKFPPVFVAHGTKDRVIPLSAVKESLDEILNDDIQSVMLEFDGGHNIPSEAYVKASRWIASR